MGILDEFLIDNREWQVTYKSVAMTIVIPIVRWLLLFHFSTKDLLFLLMIMIGYIDGFVMFMMDNIQEFKNLEQEFHWFSVVKIISLMLGFVCYFCIYVWRYPQYTWATHLLQLTLFFNVLEAGLLALEYGDYAVGILICLISPFSPKIYVNENHRVTARPGCILDMYSANHPFVSDYCSNVISVRWYFRLYYTGIGTMHLFGMYFREINFFTFSTTHIPLIVSEYYQKERFYPQFFNIRVFALFQAAFSCAGHVKRFNRDQNIVPIHAIAEVHPLYRNILHGGFMLLTIYMCVTINPPDSESTPALPQDQPPAEQPDAMVPPAEQPDAMVPPAE